MTNPTNPLANPLHIAVLKGGWSAERAVSLVSGGAIANALRSLGHTVSEIDVQKDLPTLLAALTPRPDMVFNALHGQGGEDGCIQGVLEMLDLPVTHSGIRASAMAMDKPTTKKLVTQHGVRVAHGQVLSRQQIVDGQISVAAPYIIKPAAEGSSVGVMLIREGQNDWRMSEGDADELFLVEDYIPGHELTVGIMGDQALAVTEIFHDSALFDYGAKYSTNGATHQVPANLPDHITAAAMQQALTAHQVLGCKGISRSDFRWDDQKPGTDGLYFLEINTQPGFTPTSLVPEQAQYRGISFGALCQWLVEDALPCRAA